MTARPFQQQDTGKGSPFCSRANEYCAQSTAHLLLLKYLVAIVMGPMLNHFLDVISCSNMHQHQHSNTNMQLVLEVSWAASFSRLATKGWFQQKVGFAEHSLAAFHGRE